MTPAGNVRAPSRTEICNMVVKAWNDLPEELIAKSFLICGQCPKCTPDDVVCMKEGSSAHGALEEVKNFWSESADEIERSLTIVVEDEEEIDDEEDVTMIDEDSEDDEEESDG